MKKFIILLALGSLMVLGGGQAFAELGTIDNVPAATLLLPRFEVDLTGGGVTTLFSVNNASAAPALAHVTVWTDLTVPVLDFDVYLTGYDVQTINMGDVLINGVLPQTGPHPLVSPIGSLSTGINPNPGFAALCNQGTSPPIPPVYDILPAGFIALLQAELSGQDISGGGNICTSSASGGTSLAKGYITIDSVTDCSLEFPDSATYFSQGGAGIANNDNVLWGDYFLIDTSNNFAQGFTLVHIEADASLATCVNDGSPQTFYCRYTTLNAIPGADNREALGSEYAVRYLAGGAFTGGTSLLSYRDPGEAGAAVTCGGVPWSTGVLTQASIIAFDELENPLTVVTGGPSGLPPPDAQTPFRYESNRTLIGTNLSVPADFGWLWLDLDQAQGVSPTEQNQAYVVAVMDALGAFSVGIDAIQLNNLSSAIVP